MGSHRVRHNLVTEQQHPLGNVTPSSCETGPLCLSILSWGAASRWKKMLACQGQRPGPSTQTFKHGKSLSHVWLLATPRTVAHQAPLSVGFSRQEYWSGWPCPSPGDLPHPGMEPTSPESPALAGGFLSPLGRSLLLTMLISPVSRLGLIFVSGNHFQKYAWC